MEIRWAVGPSPLKTINGNMSRISLASDANKAFSGIGPAPPGVVGSQVGKNKTDDTELKQRAGVSGGGASAPLHPLQEATAANRGKPMDSELDPGSGKKYAPPEGPPPLVLGDASSPEVVHTVMSTAPRHEVWRQSIERLGEQGVSVTPPPRQTKGRPRVNWYFFQQTAGKVLGWPWVRDYNPGNASHPVPEGENTGEDPSGTPFSVGGPRNGEGGCIAEDAAGAVVIGGSGIAPGSATLDGDTEGGPQNKGEFLLQSGGEDRGPCIRVSYPGPPTLYQEGVSCKTGDPGGEDGEALGGGGLPS